ncbi:MAG: outer membrane beta-barrel protein, partial [Rhodothermales bacterium]|nr:outer membrane beta-barrel protein [Rhodothermales bacterium]
MRMRYNFALLLFLAAAVGASDAYSQSTRSGVVTGRIIDDAGLGLQAATTALYLVADSSLISGAASDENGNYSIDGIRPGEYFVRMSFVGFTTTDSDDFVVEAGKTFQVPTTTLSEDAVALAAVNVEAERDLIEVQPDKTVLNVQGTINATGSNGLELLKKSPGVVVDNNDNIILSGKNGVKVYVDGKPSPLSTEDLAAQLRSMQASEIDAIEIITNPGAKYEAEGNAGIINIRLRRDKSLGFNSTLDLGYRQGESTSYNASSTFNFRSPKFNTFGSYAFNGGDRYNWMDIYRVQNDVLFDQESRTDSDGPGNRFRIGNDIFLNDKAVVGILVSGYVNDANRLNSSLTPIVNLASNETQSILEASSSNDGVRRNFNANANFRWDNRKGTSTNADLDYATFYNGNASFQPNYYREPGNPEAFTQNVFRSLAPTNIDVMAAKFDHERNLAGGKLGFGSKVSSVKTDNVYNFFRVEEDDSETLDVDRSNDFAFTETIGAAYLNFNGTMGRFDYSAGIRGELTQSTGELTAFKATDNNTVKREYIDLFPSGGVSFRANQNNQVRLN